MYICELFSASILIGILLLYSCYNWKIYCCWFCFISMV